MKTAPSDAESHRVLLPNGALFFLRAVQNRKEDDRGIYWCIASNPEGEVVSRKAKLDIAGNIFSNASFLNITKFEILKSVIDKINY